MLVALSLSALFTLAIPIQAAKGLSILTPIFGATFMSMDANRVASLDTGTGMISVFDIPSGAVTVFAPPTVFTTAPQIYGDKVVIANGPALAALTSLMYCVLPVPLGPCGPWIVVAVGLPSLSTFVLWSFPVFHGDIVAWPVAGGLNYYSFHAGGITAVPTAGVQPVGVSTNGDIISFVAGGVLNYADTTDCVGPCVPPIVATALPAASAATSISQNVIVFNEPGAPSLIRYYDVLSGIASPAGGGPIGTLGFGGANSPEIYGDRIAFLVSEASIGFDCNGDTVISGVDRCIRYWNFRNPAVLLTPAAAPPTAPGGGNVPFAIYDRYIAYLGPTGVRYITVPMQGDVNLDGVVNILDLAAAAFCFTEPIKNAVPPC